MTDLLPRSRRSAFLIAHLSTDRLALLSAAFVLIGIGLFGWAMHGWAEQDFGPLTSPLIPRMVVAGMNVLVIGLQTFFSAFLLGVAKRRLKPPCFRSVTDLQAPLNRLRAEPDKMRALPMSPPLSPSDRPKFAHLPG